VFILNVSSRLNPEGKKTTRSYKQGNNKQTNKKRKEKSVFITTATTKVFGKAETGIGKIQQGKKK